MKGLDKSDPLKSLETLVAKLAEINQIEPRKAIHIFRLIYEQTPKGGLSDDDLEELTGYKQSEIRRILRLLESYKIATHRRRKHPEKEVARYFWRIDSDTINIVLLNLKKKVLEKLKNRLEYEESNNFYVCPQDGTKYTVEEALTMDFTCPRCGSLLEEYDRSGALDRLKRKIAKLEEEIRRDERRIYSG